MVFVKVRNKNKVSRKLIEKFVSSSSHWLSKEAPVGRCDGLHALRSCRPCLTVSSTTYLHRTDYMNSSDGLYQAHANVSSESKERENNTERSILPSLNSSQICSLPQPPNGIRIRWIASEPIPPPPLMSCIKPVCFDVNDGPVYLASAFFHDGSIHPCKITTAHYPYHLRIPYEGRELTPFQFDFDFLVVSPDMEWVPAEKGKIPKGLRPVLGGLDADGKELYHAMGKIQDWHVPGKTGPQYVCF